MPAYLEFEVSLLDIEPRIWRRFQLDATDTFGEMHQAIQDSFDWDGDHMWEFHTTGRNRRTVAGPGAFDLGYESDEIPDALVGEAHAALQARVDDLPVHLRFWGYLGPCGEAAATRDERGTIPAPP